MNRVMSGVFLLPDRKRASSPQRHRDEVRTRRQLAGRKGKRRSVASPSLTTNMARAWGDALGPHLGLVDGRRDGSQAKATYGYYPWPLSEEGVSNAGM